MILCIFLFLIAQINSFNLFLYNNYKFRILKYNIINLINNDLILSNNCDLYYESRIKSIDKIFYKICKKKRIPKDIYGLRIIYSLKNDFKITNDDYAYYIHKLISNNYLTIDNFYDDYIKYPKRNNYQSLHLYIYDKILLEIQIRDVFMHNECINGSASEYY